MNPILAEVLVSNSSGLVSQLFTALIVGICILAIWWVGRWFIAKLGAPAVALTVWTGIFILVGLIVVINFLMGLGGKSFIRF